MQHLPFPKMLYKGGEPSGDPKNFREVANADQLEQARRDGFEEYDPEKKSQSQEERDRIRVDEERRERERLNAEGAQAIEAHARQERADEVARTSERGRGDDALATSAATIALDQKSKASATQVDPAGAVLPGRTGLEPGSGRTDAAEEKDVPDSAGVNQQSGNQGTPVRRKVSGQSAAEQHAEKAKEDAKDGKAAQGEQASKSKG